MAHKEQIDYCRSIRLKLPAHFANKSVLDVGSLDINGNNKYLFTNCTYTGLDIGPGPNVDIVCPIHKFEPAVQYDVIISTEMLEHDHNHALSLKRMYDLLRPGGLLLLTAAGEGRPEHGTSRTSPTCSPFTNDYYKNINASDLYLVLEPDRNFIEYEISYVPYDIRFCGIKR